MRINDTETELIIDSLKLSYNSLELDKNISGRIKELINKLSKQLSDYKHLKETEDGRELERMAGLQEK
jgi:hypothetical protein